MRKKLLFYMAAILCSILILGGATAMVGEHLGDVILFGEWGVILDFSVFENPVTYLYGLVFTVLLLLLYMVYHLDGAKRARKMLGGKARITESSMENSRFMTDKERNFNFPDKKFTRLLEEKKDGVPVYAVYEPKKKELNVNLAAPMHALVIGATGSGKTTTFINPMIQILGHAGAGSSMICTDPKGELFQLHSGTLSARGYKVMVLDLRDPYSSFRWNPLENLYERYQLYLKTGEGILKHWDSVEKYDLKRLHELSEYGDPWYEFQGTAYAVRRDLLNDIKIMRQKIYDEVYEDLNDLIGVICPIESKDDPVWEKGARSVIMAVCLGMLEDSEDESLSMTREKFCFYNVNKAIGNSENEFEELKNYFAKRPRLSKAVNLSRQVLSAAADTLSSYMSIAFDKLSMFNDEGLCALTSATDIDPAMFAGQPTALFLKIPDEKDTRHALAGVFILSIYKALIKVASAREDLSLPRNVYFLLDEFGNMPKIDKFDKMITVGRSRKIWFNMVVQSYAQLNNVYGDTVADIVKGNCGMKMFIGANDIGTCEEFSKLCGNMSVSTTSVSGSASSNKGEVNYSTQLQTRPLIYPSELQKLNNKTATGNAIIVTFGNYPLKTKFTPSYQCPLYQFSAMDLSELRAHAFFGDEIYYDLADRNHLVLHEDAEPEGTEPMNAEPENVEPGGAEL